jgi:hypothetical protein
VWYETIGKSPSKMTNLPSMLASMGRATATTVSALVGRGMPVGVVLCGVLGALAVVGVARQPGKAARLAMALSALATFWALTLLARGVSAASPSRYLYPASALVLVGVGELPSLIVKRVPAHHAAARPAWVRVLGILAIAAVVAYSALAIWWNSSTLVAGADGLGDTASLVHAELGAVTLARPPLAARFRPDTITMPQVSVGPFMRAVSAFGSPGDTLTQLKASGEPTRAAIDTMLLESGNMQVSLGASLGFVSLVLSHQCRVTDVGAGSQELVLRLPARGLWLQAPQATGLTVRAKWLAGSFPDHPLVELAPGEAASIRWTSPTVGTWQLEVASTSSIAPAGSFVTVCPRQGSA